jgi:thiol reductant ABC exporter CydD subunit
MASPVDPRLVRSSGAARTHLAAAGALGVLEAGVILAQALLLATVIARAAVRGAGVAQLKGELIALAAVLAARAVISAGFEISGRIGATRVMSDLRERLVSHLLREAPGQRPHDIRTGELAASAVQGVDALEAYFAGYLPQLILASIVPVAVLALIATLNAISAFILAASVPILIVAMILIGKRAQARSRKRMAALSLLSAHFLDVVRGLATLRAYRREHFEERVLADVGERYRRETLGTLRIAFLSALVLELCAMLGTAAVAATIGLQLVDGQLTLRAGLTVLLLAPELYAPLRRVGQQFHASADGSAAAERIFATLDCAPVVKVPEQPQRVPDLRRVALSLRHVSYEYPGRGGLALDGVDLALPAGSITALMGPSGSGKSSIARLLLRLADPTSGAITVGPSDLRALDLGEWRAQVAWVPQHPTLFTGTIADNIRLGSPDASVERVRDAVSAAGLTETIAALPSGLATVIGEGGRRLSAGQRQRIALARAFVQDAPLLILDEPTTHLDGDNSSAIADSIAHLAQGRTTLLIVHDDVLALRADQVVRLEHGRIVSAVEMPPALELAA